MLFLRKARLWRIEDLPMLNQSAGILTINGFKTFSELVFSTSTISAWCLAPSQEFSENWQMLGFHGSLLRSQRETTHEQGLQPPSSSFVPTLEGTSIGAMSGTRISQNSKESKRVCVAELECHTTGLHTPHSSRPNIGTNHHHLPDFSILFFNLSSLK